jgi:hypothetical protein
MSTSTPQTRDFIALHNLHEGSAEASFMRKLEKQNNALQAVVSKMKRDMKTIEAELRPAAFNQKSMQIARPARTCINIAKKY